MGDMRTLSKYFNHEQFDAVWAQASLLHLRRNQMKTTLLDIQQITKNNAVVYIDLKGGVGTKIHSEDKYGKPMVREFTLWGKEEFLAVTKRLKWSLVNYSTEKGSFYQGIPTQWHQFIFLMP